MEECKSHTTIVVNEALTFVNAICKLQSLPHDEQQCGVFFNFTIVPPGVSQQLYSYTKHSAIQKTLPLILCSPWCEFINKCISDIPCRKMLMKVNRNSIWSSLRVLNGSSSIFLSSATLKTKMQGCHSNSLVVWDCHHYQTPPFHLVVQESLNPAWDLI